MWQPPLGAVGIEDFGRWWMDSVMIIVCFTAVCTALFYMVEKSVGGGRVGLLM